MNEGYKTPFVVFDCMIYLQSLINASGPSAAALRLVDNDIISLFVSMEILKELYDVLSRPKIRIKNRNINDRRRDAFINRISNKATVITNVQRHFIYSRDPKDEKYINLAIEVKAEFLVIRDKDLLDLMTDITQESLNFRRNFCFLKIIDPVKFLKVLPS